MRFNSLEVLSALTNLNNPMTVKEASKFLNVSLQNTRFLIYGGYLKPDAYLGKNASAPSHIFDAKTVSAFSADYVYAKGGEILVDGVSVSDSLKRKGIKPAIDLANPYNKGGRTTFYRRADVDRELAQMNL